MIPVPTNLRFTANDDGSILLEWDSVDGAQAYRVYEPDLVVRNGLVEATQLLREGFISAYGYAVQAVGEEDVSVLTDPIMVTGNATTEPVPEPPVVPTSPATPTNFTAVVNTDDTVQLQWDDTPGATNYRIYESVMSGTSVVAEVTISESKRGPLADGPYKYSVSAVNAHGESTKTAEASITVGDAPAPPNDDSANLIWKANFSPTEVRNSSQVGFTRVQRQYGTGSISTTDTPIAGGNVSELGPCIVHKMDDNQSRLEARPGDGGYGYSEGEEYYFRVDFSLGDDFPINQSDPWCGVQQIHQGSGSGSPPVEFDVYSGALYVRGSYNQDGGNRTTYTRKLTDVVRRKKYKLVWRSKFSSVASRCLLEVWINDKKVVDNFVPPSPNIWGGDSYWKGSTMYCRSNIPPLTCYQNNHRVGRSYASVAS